jgi:hypothetical protein
MALTSVSTDLLRSELQNLLKHISQWKVFNFFDISEVKPPDDGESYSIFDVSLH